MSQDNWNELERNGKLGDIESVRQKSDSSQGIRLENITLVPTQLVTLGGKLERENIFKRAIGTTSPLSPVHTDEWIHVMYVSKEIAGNITCYISYDVVNYRFQAVPDASIPGVLVAIGGGLIVNSVASIVKGRRR
jgi:hypothetical protein